ncbi:CvpA family protein [Cloacibacillus porcorum]|uniref:CvpA family protein n=1 Tax=Cloacibacillus porcorum TaxID=1197717 RepID=UPI00145947B0|nr:CvpA family protein [Cloacibacillus porcorum]MCC8183531.1 CvpA family protein [Cloacibacillus porcorum]MCD7875370.1 CvpA family protein [Cloacibacillus porcorum]MCI5866271.1 CvpA family protein [Cloacibacillus porcorum]MDD7648301.1 CvpA family protein [Cloacibacillus porcorum]MDY4092302.1 CvpA family protein [Cloacibacillus porcorum]
MSLSGWNYWDIFFIILGCYFIIRGSFRGFVGEVITLVGFLASFYLSFHYSGGIGRFLSVTMGLNAYMAQAAAAVLIWLSVTLIAAMLRMILKSLIGAASLGGIDKLLGLFSGVIKSVIVVYVVITGGLLLAPVVTPTWMSQSDILRYAGRSWPQFRAMFIDLNLLPEGTTLPDGTLEQILRPYRTGGGGPEGYDPTPGRT